MSNMNLKEYDNKCVRITDIDDSTFEGICSFNNKEFNECEYGRNEDSLDILNIKFYKPFIKEVEVIKDFNNKEYGNLEELIIDSGIDFIEDALEYENDIHKDRLKLCIKDNIDKFNDKEKTILLKITKK